MIIFGSALSIPVVVITAVVWRQRTTILRKKIEGKPGCAVAKNLSVNTGDTASVLGQEVLLEKETATHSSILAWRIPWTEEPGGLQSVGSHRVGHD